MASSLRLRTRPRSVNARTLITDNPHHPFRLTSSVRSSCQIVADSQRMPRLLVRIRKRRPPFRVSAALRLSSDHLEDPSRRSLLNDLGNASCADGLAALADRETQTLIH